MQFLANGFLIIGSGILLLTLNIRLGGAALLPALAVLIITQAISGWVKRANFSSLQTLGGLSGEIQESLANFKVVVAFNRLDYFREKFNTANRTNYQASVRAGIANNVFIPLYGLAYNLAQLIVLAFGVWMISNGDLTTGLLIGFLLYVNSFYNPLRQLAAAWSSLQLALAALDRISEVLALTSDMPQLPSMRYRPPTRRCSNSMTCPLRIRAAAMCCPISRSDSSAAALTPWSARPAAARPRRRR